MYENKAFIDVNRFSYAKEVLYVKREGFLLLVNKHDLKYLQYTY
jgi:hypothetical protein